MKMNVNLNASDMRARAYPSSGDQLDAMWKILNTVMDTLTPNQRAQIPQEALDVLSTVKDVKARIPRQS